MLKTPDWLSRFNSHRTHVLALAPLTLGVSLLVTMGLPVCANPVFIQQGGYSQGGYIQGGYSQGGYIPGIQQGSYIQGIPQGGYVPGIQQQSPLPYIYGSPIPSPIPLTSGIGATNSNIGNYYPSPNYGIGIGVLVPSNGIIQNSTLINPTVVNSQINDSVLVNPVIVNPTTYPRNYVKRSRILYGSPNLQIQLGY